MTNTSTFEECLPYFDNTEANLQLLQCFNFESDMDNPHSIQQFKYLCIYDKGTFDIFALRSLPSYTKYYVPQHLVCSYLMQVLSTHNVSKAFHLTMSNPNE